METINCIKTRRSRRLFLDKEIEKDKINKILECAIASPSSIDCQPWHFVIVKEQKEKRELAKLKTEDNQKHILTAPISIVVCVDMNKSPKRYIEDGVTATQNILLIAHDLGLGSVYVTGFNPLDESITEKIRNILSIPKNVIPITILPIGYIDDAEKLKNKKPLNLNNIIHYNRW